MKYKGRVILLFIIMTSCQSPNKKENPVNDLIGKFKPFLNGTWVTSDYIDDLTKTKSPLQSSKYLNVITEFSIDTTGILSDSTIVVASFGNHEGGNFIIYFRMGNSPNSISTNIKGLDDETGYCDLGYITNASDTSLLLFHYNKNKKLLDKTKYIKVVNYESSDDASGGLQYLVNKNLIAGTYKMIDSTGGETIIELANDGKIKGLSGFKTYYIDTDFVADGGIGTDEICFDIQTKNQKCYGFQFENGNINLFEPPKDEPDTTFKPGPTIYKLVKAKGAAE